LIRRTNGDRSPSYIRSSDSPRTRACSVIEHNLDVVRNADWILDLGPEGGSRGGEIVFTGTPTDLLTADRSLTGAYLRRAEPAVA
jgi:excinuclease UvrABC ATPase subunit